MDKERFKNTPHPNPPPQGRREKNEFKRIIAAFGYSIEGLKTALSHPAFRIEFIVALVMTPLAVWLGKSRAERALLIGSLLLVLIVELLNTGIESAIDRISREIHPLSKRAKDVGSSAVLVSLVNAAAIWFLILFT